ALKRYLGAVVSEPGRHHAGRVAAVWAWTLALLGRAPTPRRAPGAVPGGAAVPRDPVPLPHRRRRPRPVRGQRHHHDGGVPARPTGDRLRPDTGLRRDGPTAPPRCSSSEHSPTRSIADPPTRG